MCRHDPSFKQTITASPSKPPTFPVARLRRSVYRSKVSDHADYASHCDTRHPEGARRQSLCGSLRESLQLVTTQRDKLREDVKFRILRLLEDNPHMSQRELAKEVGVSTGGIHYVLNALLNKGLLKVGNFTAAKDKRRYAYVLTPKGLSEKADLTQRFLARKRAEYAALKEEIDALEQEASLGADMGPAPWRNQ